MISQYVRIIRLLREMARKCREGIDADRFQADGYAQATIGDFLLRDARELRRIWPKDLSTLDLDSLISGPLPSSHDEFARIERDLLTSLEDRVDEYFEAQPSGDLHTILLDLLHPRITDASYGAFRQGRYRDAVLNSIIAVFELIRERTSLDGDGTRLISEVFSLDDPFLVLSNLESDSGRNDQKGFLQIFQGAYVGIRNPKAHSLSTDLDLRKAAQYLVFASLLARRVQEARLVKTGSHSPPDIYVPQAMTREE